MHLEGVSKGDGRDGNIKWKIPPLQEFAEVVSGNPPCLPSSRAGGSVKPVEMDTSQVRSVQNKHLHPLD